MRTLEFGLYPTKSQELQLFAWLELHRRIWNYGLALLIELDRFTAYDKASKARLPCCPLPWMACHGLLWAGIKERPQCG
jgi:transposase